MRQAHQQCKHRAQIDSPVPLCRAGPCQTSHSRHCRCLQQGHKIRTTEIKYTKIPFTNFTSDITPTSKMSICVTIIIHWRYCNYQLTLHSVIHRYAIKRVAVRSYNQLYMTRKTCKLDRDTSKIIYLRHASPRVSNRYNERED